MNYSVETFLMFAGRLHPALVHFPIALILVAAFMEIFRIKRGEASKAARACLAFGVLGAIFAAFSGWRYAIEGHGSSMPDELFQHRWGAVIVAGVSSLTWLLGCLAGSKPGSVLMTWYRIGLLFSACLVGYVGFLGGQMVYKPGHLTDVFKIEEPPTPQPKKEPAAPIPLLPTGELEPVLELREPKEPAESTQATEAEASLEPLAVEQGAELLAVEQQAKKASPSVDYATQIQPIFELHCYECHGPTGRAKAGMRLSAVDELFVGDAEFWIMQPGNAAGSLLVELISNPSDGEDVMPPMKGDKPAEVLSLEQIALISRWIDQGAKFEAQ